MKIGVLGGGQLGRMLALAGYPLGLRFRFYDPAPDATAGQVADLHNGSYSDWDALARFAEGLEVVTYEFENVPVQTARFLAERAPVYPPLDALHYAQDRLHEKNFFRQLDIPVADFFEVNSLSDLQSALEKTGTPAVLKTRRLGYDGKGQAVIRQPDEVEPAWDRVGRQPSVLESFVLFERELSILSVRSQQGETAFYPLVRNHHREGILRFSIAPARKVSPTLQAQAESYAKKVMDALEYVGVLAIELFQAGGTLIANEFAPRVHNSGHWTIEGAETSQFENHLRAILGFPLGSTRVAQPCIMVNLIGQIPDLSDLLKVSGLHVHLYGKEPRPGRKVGHFTYLLKT